jgi:tetratricopeptide (TPR) repeat protein
MIGQVLDYRARLIVAQYQKNAFHSFICAIKILERHPEMIKPDYASLLWGDFAILLQSMISSPMSGQALKMSKQKFEFWAAKAIESGSIQSFQPPAESTLTKPLYTVMSHILKNAIRMDKTQWAFYFRLAHCFRKLNRSSTLVVNTYCKAINLLPKEFGLKDQDSSLDILYKCTTFILKEYTYMKVSEKEAIELFRKMEDYHLIIKEVKSTVEVKLEGDNVTLQALKILESIKKVDKKRWFHKPFYRIARIYYKLGKLDAAKEEMATLLNARSKSGMRRIWKTELELYVDINLGMVGITYITIFI